MSYASKAGRAKITASSPQALAVCDRCGFIYNHINLQWQFDWRGATMLNTGSLVCRHCLDTPQQQQRAITVPADPVPIQNPRVQNWADYETDYRVAASIPTIDPTTGLPVYNYERLVTPDGQYLTTQPIGAPTGTRSSPSMPAFGEENYFPPLSVLALFANGGYTVTITCSQPHGLVTDGQISVKGSSSSLADGAYSVIVNSAMALTYNANTVIPAGSLLTGTTVVYPVNIGLPYNYDQLPQTGI